MKKLTIIVVCLMAFLPLRAQKWEKIGDRPQMGWSTWNKFAGNINEEVIHGIPSKKRIVHDGDLVSLDIGINLGGYISDSTHTVMVGSVKSEHRKLVKVTRESLNAGIFACTAGHRINDITNAVYEIAHEQNGYGVFTWKNGAVYEGQWKNVKATVIRR